MHGGWEGGERGRALLGPVVSWTSPLEKSTERHEWSHPKYGLPRSLARLKSLTLFQACADGGTLGPKAVLSGCQIHIQNRMAVRKGLDIFAAPIQRNFEKFAPDYPSKKAIRASHGEAATGELGVSPPGKLLPDAGLVTGRPWASESEPKVNLYGPRRYSRWRDIGRCLTDVDDGGCSVLFCSANFVDIRIFTEISGLFSPIARLAGGFLGESSGELLVADLRIFRLKYRGTSARVFKHF